LLLLILLEPLLAPAHSTGQAAHRCARGRSRAGIARYRAAYRSERGATPLQFCLSFRKIRSLRDCLAEQSEFELSGDF